MINRASKIICLSLLVLMLGIPSLAQNTKGDKPAGTNRETRFKTPKKSGQKRKPGRRIREKADKPSNRASIPRSRSGKGDRVGRPIRPLWSKSKPQSTQQAWKGDITGRRIRSRSSGSAAKNIYPQTRYINSSSRELKRNRRANVNPMVKRVQRLQQQDRPKFTRRTVMPRPSPGRARRVFSQKSFYVNNKSIKPPSYQAQANRSAFSRMQRHPGQDRPRVKHRKIVPRSASAAYIARRSTNTWAHFSRPKRKQERATTKDLAGKKLRTKNFETQRPVLTNPTWSYQKRVAIGERPYKGPAAGGYVSRTKTGQRAWRGDVAHRAIRGGKSPQGVDRPFFGFLKGGGFRSASRTGPKQGVPLPGRRPGIGANGISKYQGNIKASQRRGFGNQGEGYSGSIKARRKFKGGGSVSGSWNNHGRPVVGRPPGRGGDRVDIFQGNMRSGRRGFNNQGEEYTGNIKMNGRRGFDEQGEGYSGNMKLNRRRGFSNQGEEYTGNLRANGRRGFTNQGEEYTGNLKARRPQKGGGSVSGKLWNNDGTPIEVRVHDARSKRVATYQGNIRAGRKGFTNQGEEYSGNIKTRRPANGGGSISGKLWNNDETPIEVRAHDVEGKRMATYQGNVKVKRPEKGGGSVSGQLWNNDEKPLYVRAPKNVKNIESIGNIKLARKDYSKNRNSSEASLRGIKATRSTVKAGEFSRGARRPEYIKNPSSADESQKTREPGRAFARSADFQGNIKMKKFDLFNKRDLHPDASFVKLNKNNVSEEKDMLTNFKLWWARLFKKSDTQPDHLKEKERKPRYDSGESGLWYD